MDIQYHGGDEDSGNVFAVETIAESGAILQSHKHEHGHMSVLVSGVAEVTIDEKTETHEGYKMIFIPAGSMHKVVAITPIIWLCLWSGDKVNIEQAKKLVQLVKEI